MLYPNYPAPVRPILLFLEILLGVSHLVREVLDTRFLENIFTGLFEFLSEGARFCQIRPTNEVVTYISKAIKSERERLLHQEKSEEA